MNQEKFIEEYKVPYSIIYSIPIRMPGIILQVNSSKSNFQITLKGGDDEEGNFEPSTKENTWIISPLHYAFGRVVHDIIWETGTIDDDCDITINICYSAIINNITITENEKDSLIPFTNFHSLAIKTWSLTFNPMRWLKIPPSNELISLIRIKWRKINNENNISDVPTTEFKLILATIPIKIIDLCSKNQILDLSNVGHKKFLNDSKLNFSKIFCAWIEFQNDVDWSIWEANIIYEIEK
jgi:hypothetical protein